MNILVFDIETIPDTENGARLLELEGLNEREIAQAMFQLQRQKNGSDFIRHYLQKIVAISVILRSQQRLKIWSLGDADSHEAELLQRFFDGIEKHRPTLVSWNGCGFDLPVIHYRALLHGVTAPCYWDTGEQETEFRWNNYLNRFHTRHTDLMDVLSGYQMRAAAPLDEIAMLLGLPGKMGMSGTKVWDYFQQGQIEQIRNYCETDVLNTYLVYLRFQVISGKLSCTSYKQECELVRSVLINSQAAHLNSFLTAWKSKM